MGKDTLMFGDTEIKKKNFTAISVLVNLFISKISSGAKNR